MSSTYPQEARMRMDATKKRMLDAWPWLKNAVTAELRRQIPDPKTFIEALYGKEGGRHADFIPDEVVEIAIVYYEATKIMACDSCRASFAASEAYAKRRCPAGPDCLHCPTCETRLRPATASEETMVLRNALHRAAVDDSMTKLVRGFERQALEASTAFGDEAAWVLKQILETFIGRKDPEAEKVRTLITGYHQTTAEQAISRMKERSKSEGPGPLLELIEQITRRSR